jgi:hypothetical protein
LTVLVTDRYLHVSHEGTNERCRQLLAQFPPPFRAGHGRVRVPRSRITEPVRTDDDSLVIGVAGYDPVRLTVYTIRPRYHRLAEWLRTARQGASR